MILEFVTKHFPNKKHPWENSFIEGVFFWFAAFTVVIPFVNFLCFGMFIELCQEQYYYIGIPLLIMQFDMFYTIMIKDGKSP